MLPRSARLVMDVSWSVEMSVAVMRMPSSMPAVVRVMMVPVPYAQSPSSSIPRVIISPISTVVPWIVPSCVVERIVPSVVTPRCVCPCIPSPCVTVPWVVVTSPVPRAAYAVWIVIVAVGVEIVVSPVIWGFGNRHDGAAQLLVILDLRGQVFL